jgi:nitrite reductase/ring-hydroxylating ferredoxin subunit
MRRNGLLNIPTIGRIIVSILLPVLLTTCEDTTMRSSVPTYPVRLTINTQLGQFVHFVPEATYDYITIDRQGYHYHNYTQALAATDMIGYGGVIVYIDGGSRYNAFDMCCPHCLDPKHPVEMDGFFAVCPICGERYDMSWGLAVPTQRIATEALRRYPIIQANGKLTISQ